MTPDPTPQPDHGAAGFCTDHAQAADRPTTVAEAVKAGAGFWPALAGQNDRDAWAFMAERDEARAEVERLQAGIVHIVDRYGNAPGIETCATMHDLRRLARVTP